MRKLTTTLALIISLSTFSQLIYKGQEFAFVGPMLHFNIGNKQTKVSLGLEASYWKVIRVESMPVGGDIGIDYEFGSKKLRLYSEAQIGSGMGISLGPVIELQDGQKKLGVQASTWLTLFGGIDFRWRKTDKHYFAPGMMFKLPLKKI